MSEEKKEEEPQVENENTDISTNSNNIEKPKENDDSNVFEYHIDLVPETLKNAFYISDPVLVNNVVHYSLKGHMIQDVYTRRFSEFYSLRLKLAERWPGVYIPFIPPKQAIGNKDYKVIEKRTRILNDFCYRLSNFNYLLNSEEVQIFITSKAPELSKQISELNKHDYQTIYEKYKENFTDCPSDYDLPGGKNKLNEFLNFIKRSQGNLKIFQDVVIKALNCKNKELVELIDLIKKFEGYEKYDIMGFADGNENKLIFFNPANSQLSEKVMFINQNLKNPYMDMRDYLENELLDHEAMIEALNSLNNLSVIKDKITQEHDKADNDLKAINMGAKKISLLFKNKAKMTNQLELTIKDTEENIKYLNEIIKMASYNMEQYREKFKEEKLRAYHKHLKRYALMQINNDKILKEIWELVGEALMNQKEQSSLESM